MIVTSVRTRGQNQYFTAEAEVPGDNDSPINFVISAGLAAVYLGQTIVLNDDDTATLDGNIYSARYDTHQNVYDLQ